jgi:hypothetical protein
MQAAAATAVKAATAAFVKKMGAVMLAVLVVLGTIIRKWYVVATYFDAFIRHQKEP